MKRITVFLEVLGSAKQILPMGKRAEYLHFRVANGTFISISGLKKKLMILSQNIH